MANVNKIIQKMKNQPNGITLSEIEKVLEYLGYKKYTGGGKGSHQKYYKDTGEVIIIPGNKNPVKSVYVRDILK
ncbi:MAG: type II toxin-antitoxin system HicA family toxin, partial [Eubacteriales bacterium]|nr:type II toxin-antitoxin system HicA family toxin [Eubacteriales bacterium]